MATKSKRPNDAGEGRARRRTYRREMREQYNAVLRAALAQNIDLPHELRELRLLRPLARGIDEWSRVATLLDLRGNVHGRIAAVAVSMVLHAVTDALLRSDRESLASAATWAKSYLNDRGLAHPLATASDREMAVRDAVAMHLAASGVNDATPRFVVAAYGAQFPDQINLYEDYLDVERFVRSKLGPPLPDRIRRMLGSRTLTECADTAVALLRLMLRHPRWSLNVSKNFLKADYQRSARARRAKPRQSTE